MNNIHKHEGYLTKTDREAYLGQTAVTIWFSGLSGSGKTTLSIALERALLSDGFKCVVLDGDGVRFGLNKDLGFSSADRSENIRRVAELAKLLNNAGLIVICAFISPFVVDREIAREIIGEDAYKEVFINASLKICESRDPKGLYAKARAGQIADFTGISSPYEVPSDPDLIINTAELDVEESLSKLMSLFR